MVCISDRSFTNEQVLIMEKRILGRLEWNLTVPTPYVFLVRFIKASMTGSDVRENVKFLLNIDNLLRGLINLMIICVGGEYGLLSC